MRRAVAVVALGLSALTVTPASAGCVEDFVSDGPTQMSFAQVLGTVEVGDDYSVTARPGWVIAHASGAVGAVNTFVACVV